jgi:hypothetical protein
MNISQVESVHQPDIWPLGPTMPVCSECSDYDRAMFREWPCDAARMVAEIKRLRGNHHALIRELIEAVKLERHMARIEHQALSSDMDQAATIKRLRGELALGQLEKFRYYNNGIVLGRSLGPLEG